MSERTSSAASYTDKRLKQKPRAVVGHPDSSLIVAAKCNSSRGYPSRMRLNMLKGAIMTRKPSRTATVGIATTPRETTQQKTRTTTTWTRPLKSLVPNWENRPSETARIPCLLRASEVCKKKNQSRNCVGGGSNPVWFGLI